MNSDTTILQPCPVCGGKDLSETASEPGLAIMRCGACSMFFASPYCSQFSDKCDKCGRRCLKSDSAAPDYYAGLDGAPLYSGASVFYSHQLTETSSGRAPGFDFSGREAEQTRAFCAPDIRGALAFPRANGIPHFLVSTKELTDYAGK